MFLGLLNSDVLPLPGGDFTEGVIEELDRSLILTKVRSYKLDMRLNAVTVYIKISIKFILGYVVVFTTHIKLMILLDQINSILRVTHQV